MGTTYLRICCCLSLGAIGYTVYERFLQSTGKTMLSTISQISGAVTNIVLDYVFIFPCKMGVAGAAWATVIGQFVSLALAMIFHYTLNKEINGNPKYIKPEFNLIKGIYKIGISAAIMQALLSVMMAGMNAILGGAKANPTILVGSFGIYYKIQQIALFSAFGLSNTIISILSFNYGMKDRKRIDDCIKYGIIDTLIVTLILTAIFEIFARSIANLFGLTGGTTTEIIDICKIALRIASIGYIFMGFSVAVQGVLQSIGYAIRPLVISLLRLVIFVFPIAYFFTLSDNVTNIVWWTFPIAEILTAIVSIFILRKSYKERIENIKETELSKVSKGNRNLVISISREHGTNGKEIARKVAENLGLKFYDKEEMKKYAISHSFESNNHSDDELYKFYLSLDAEKDSIIKQSEIIKSIASEDNCVIVGRCSDYILKDNPNLIKIFLYAPLEYRINKVKEIYKDTYQEAKKHVIESDKSRASYYEVISNQSWGDKENYDLCLNCEIGNDAIVKIICDYIKNRN
jgi:Na+-driven multidrug efflux pump/cytidylate kinase